MFINLFLKIRGHKMKIFNIDNGWTIKLPENWKEEKDEVDGYHIYYPPDTDLTIRTPTFHFLES